MVNPLSVLPELLGKLGSEHFSAEVQGKHIALLKEQFAVLERENIKLTRENAELTSKTLVLQSEKEVLEAKFHQLTKENEILQRKIQEYEQPTNMPSHDILLDEHKVNILKLLFNSEKIENIPISQVAHDLKMNLQLVNYHLEELQKIKMVKYVQVYIKNIVTLTHGTQTSHDSVSGCAIEQKGRKYLIDNGMI